MLVSLLMSLIFVGVVSGDFPEARLVYQTSYSEYRESVVNYQVARSEFLTYETLVSRAQAEQSTRQMLLDRHEVVLRYLDMIEQRLLAVPDLYVDEAQKTTLLADIDTNRKWFVSQTPTIENAETLSEFESFSRAADKRIVEMISLGYQVHAVVLLAGLEETQASVTDLLGSTTEQVLRVRSDNELDGAQLERWLVDADQKLQLADTNIVVAASSISEINSKADFTETRLQLQRARRYQAEANQFLGEIVRNTKIQDE